MLDKEQPVRATSGETVHVKAEYEKVSDTVAVYIDGIELFCVDVNVWETMKDLLNQIVS